MWVLVVINALGLIGGALFGDTVMYVFFGFSFVAFFHEYAKISWDLIYERESYLVGLGGKMDMAITNELVSFFVMVVIYWMLVSKTGMLSVVVSALQCLVFQLLRLGSGEGENRLKAVLFVVELVIAFLFMIL